MKQQNETVLITGATSGIGYELARLFARDGYKLIITGRYPDSLDRTARQLAEEYQAEVIPVAKDLFHPQSPFELYDEIKAKGLQVDVLVNDAAQGQYGLFAETDIRRQLDIIQLNISSLVALTYLYLKEMTARGSGKILNLSSIASKAAGPWQSVYHGTKAFVQSFTEALHSEVKDLGVTVTALLPGVTNTDFFNKAGMNASKVAQDKDQMADPADVAGDGYKALMQGDDMIISGFKNKIQVAMGNVLPDAAAAEQMKKQQEPVHKKGNKG